MLNMVTQGSGKPLVLFHGWGFNGQIWFPALNPLLQSYSLHCIDLPAHGLSSDMEWDSFKCELLQRVPGRFDVVGWSMGGLFATRLALEVSERVERVFIVASSPYFIRDIGWPGIDEDVFLEFYRFIDYDSLSAFEEFLQMYVPEVLSDQDWNPCSRGLQALQKSLNLLKNWDLRSSLFHLRQPIAYLFGHRDKIIPIKTMKVMQAMHPHFHYVSFEKASHAPFLSHREDFLTQLERFLS